MNHQVEIEGHGEDALALPTLARGAQHAATSSAATGGHPEQSRRYQEILVPTGVTREMRGRAELTAELFFDQHAPRIDNEVPIGSTGLVSALNRIGPATDRFTEPTEVVSNR